MKNITIKSFLAAVAATVALGSCGGGKEGSATQTLVDSLTMQVEQQQQEIDTYQECIDMVTNLMDSLAISQDVLIGDNNGTDRGSKDAIRQRVNNMAEMMASQKTRIDELQQKLNAMNSSNAKLKQTVAYLSEQLENRNTQIMDLQRIVSQQDFDIHQFKSELNRMANLAQQQSEQIAEQEQSLKKADLTIHEAYYVIGTGSELKDKGVLKGGSLLKKKSLNVNEMNTAAFTKIDIRTAKEFNVPSKSIELMTQHPKDSYTINVDKGADTSVLRIVDQQAFWSLSRYLVIKL
ncbi:MAG: hypothetical protein K5928_02565 [Prevotella sp.]|nr:hypothetical protein [Prevotella sp.]